jgi:hypothetical protein
MVKSEKKYKQIAFKALFYLYLVVFPLGQLVTNRLTILGLQVTLHTVDLIVGLSVLLVIVGKIKATKIFIYFLPFLFSAAFSLALSTSYFSAKEIILGSLYLARLFSYSTFFLLIYYLVKSNTVSKTSILNLVIAEASVIAVFGWLQYLLVPDVRFLKLLGWDDHYYRIIGTFYDPAFTSILLVLGFIATLSKVYAEKRKYVYQFALIIIGSALLFTYARAAYLALLSGVGIFFILKNKLKLVLLFALFLLVVLPLLPRPEGGEGVKLERVYSVFQKKDNYIQTFKIIEINPLFGVGYNNLCTARVKYLGDRGYTSHSCSGSDSSILLILATTGIVGLIMFINFLVNLFQNNRSRSYKDIFTACSVSLLIHSFFVNSLFYPWVLGYMAVLYSLSYEPIKD